MNIKDLLKDAYREGMSVEDIEKALESIELPNDGSAEIERLTAALSKSNSEAANYKKQLREKMTAEEAKAKEDADKMADLQSKYDTLLKESTISKNKARLLALGYDDALATEAAEAMMNGDTDKVFTCHKKHLDSVEKKIREDVLKNTPRPTGGNSSDIITKEKFSKMSIEEQFKFSTEHPEEYKMLYGGK
jgi:hypothetical protein